jgi:streptogramin lyase
MDVPGGGGEPIPANVVRRGRLSVRWATVRPSTGRIASVDDAGAYSKHPFFEHPLPPSAAGPDAIATGPGAPWFTKLGDDAVGRTIPAGDLVEYPLPAIGSSPAGISAAR